jgi:hypothetical protein
MSFAGTEGAAHAPTPRRPGPSAAFQQRFAGRVNRTGRDGQLENYSRVRPGARGARIARERKGIPPGQIAPSQSSHAVHARRASRTGSYGRGAGGGAAVDKPNTIKSPAPPPTPPPPMHYDPLETATSSLKDDEYASVIDDAYESEPEGYARRYVPQSPIQQRPRKEARPKHGDARNADLIHKPRDQLYYSKKARAVSNFQPYTLTEYRKTKPTQYMELEPLRPNLDLDPALQEKRAKAAKLKAYSKRLDLLNKATLAKQPKHRSPSPPPRQPTRVDKARVYAQTIPAPRQKSRGAAAAAVEAAVDVAPVEEGVAYASDDDGPWDDGDLYKPTRLELLELQHDQRRAAAAELRGAYGM